MAALRAFSAKGEVRDFPSFNYSAREPPPSIPPSGPLHPLSHRPTISIQRKSPQRESLDSRHPSIRPFNRRSFRSVDREFRNGDREERERGTEKRRRGGSKVKKNFKPGRKRFDANCPLFPARVSVSSRTPRNSLFVTSAFYSSFRSLLFDRV